MKHWRRFVARGVMAAVAALPLAIMAALSPLSWWFIPSAAIAAVVSVGALVWLLSWCMENWNG